MFCRHPVVVGITQLELEHTHMLGNTLEEIASNKAGIIKTGSLAAFTTDSNASVMPVLQKRADLCGVIYNLLKSN